MPRFVIDLGDIEMSGPAQSALNQDLQKVALQHIAGLRFEKPVAFRFPPDWLGLIMRRNFEQIARAEQEIEQMAGHFTVGRG